jgi:hypothetical protein
MTTGGLILAAVGVVLVAIGAVRARNPWARYRTLKAQEDNIARYESWRGGLRETGPTGASVAMDMLGSQLRVDAVVAAVGIVAALIGVFLK